MTKTASTRPAVLVVDDLEGNRVAMHALLESMACDITLADSGDEALRQLLKQQFAVMLLDVQMPGMDGYEVARHARLNPMTANVPIIFVTATHETEEGTLRGYGSGAVDYLFKPVNPTILRSKVRVFLELYERRKQVDDGLKALTKAYDNLRATQAQLVQSEKMASLGQLVAGIAHEINNPLSFCVSHLSVARSDLERVNSNLGETIEAIEARSWQRARARLAEMGIGLDRIGDLVLKLRTFSRLDEDERKHASVNESLASVTTILRHRMGEHVTLETDLCDADTIECYPGLLNQALMNLLSNAIDALENQDQGTIRITTRRDAESFSIMVADNGPGIPKELRDRIFDPFFTTKPVGQGTGLGLSITHSIVRRHAGSLKVSDNEGIGTRFTITLPLHIPA